MTVVALAVLGLVGGIGITAIGPGGVIPTIGLFTLTGLTPPQVAGTAIVTQLAAGLLGTAVYARSGQLRSPAIRRTALVLVGSAIVGTPLGIVVNGLVSRRAFGILLAVIVVVTAALVFYREYRAAPRASSTPRVWLSAAIGFGVAVSAGAVGVGGPMLTVPLLIAAGCPVLGSLAAAQAQSVVIAAVGTAGYAMAGAIDWPLAVAIGVPQLIGVLIGWRIAHHVPARQLKYGLVAVLVVLAPYLVLTG